MMHMPAPWSGEELAASAATSAANFRELRLKASDAWSRHVDASHAKFARVMRRLQPGQGPCLSETAMMAIVGDGLGEALRYLAGPPISEDDMRVLVDAEALTPARLAADASLRARMLEVMSRAIDPRRFPWLAERRAPTEAEIASATLASSVLLAAQRISTERRMDGKGQQETAVTAYLVELGLQQVEARPILTLVKGPQVGQFCGECLLGERKADVVVRLPDTRLLAIECKVSNSATNSVKRLNNDAAVKAEYWLKQFGVAQVVPAAVLSGVFNPLNLEQAQQRGLSLFWAHDLRRLGSFIEGCAR
jgi:XamI restriction endonuclease